VYSHVFVIGFNKTGTSSIHALFLRSNWPSLHWGNNILARVMLENVISGKKVFEGYDSRFLVFSDLVYRNENFLFEGNSLLFQMQRDYPYAKFIYNTRPIEDWIKSRTNHRHRIEGLTLLELQKKLLNTDSTEKVQACWRELRLDFEKKLDYLDQDRLLRIDIRSTDFVDRVSEFTELKLNPEVWGIYNKTQYIEKIS